MKRFCRVALPLAAAGFLAATLLPADYAHPLSASRAVRTADGGWRFDKPSLFCSGPMPDFLERVAFREGRFAVEVAVKVTEFSPHDTMRIVTYSQNDVSWSLNWAVGHRRRSLVVRHRGSSPRCQDAVEKGAVQHFVVSYGDGEATLFRDGVFFQKRRHAPPKPWAQGSHLVVGNELTGDRPFVGSLYLLRIYDRPVEAPEAARLHRAFADGTEPPPLANTMVLTLRPSGTDDFELSSPGGPAIPIRRVAWPFTHKLRQFLTMPRGLQEVELLDIGRNVLGTVPLGLLAVWGFGLPLWAILLGQFVLSLAVELAQIFAFTLRFADLTDLGANLIGSLLGALFARWLHARLRRHGGELPA